MSNIFDNFFKVFRHFDQFFIWLHDTLKFYPQPKLFIENLTNLKTKDIIKKLLEFFCFYEGLLLIISSTLIDKIQFGLFKIPGLVILDAIFALPLIIIVSISLYVAKVAYPVKKSVCFVLLFKIFYGLPISIFFFLFVFFEDYVFYILFGAGIQLFFLILLLSPSLFFAEKKKQLPIILGTTIGLFVLFVFIYAQVSRVNPSAENMVRSDSFFDPIFSEYRKIRKKTKLIDEIEIKDEIEKVESYSKLIEEKNIDLNLEKLREDQKYHTEFILNRIKIETELFNKGINCYFEVNKKRYEVYLDFLNELSNYQEKYYSVFNIFDLEKKIRKNQKEIDLLTSEMEKYQKSKITEFNKIDYSKISNESELIKRLEEEVKQRKLAYEYAELEIKLKKVEILKMENKIKIQEILDGIFKEANKLEGLRFKFIEDEINYYSFIIKLRNLIFI